MDVQKELISEAAPERGTPTCWTAADLRHWADFHCGTKQIIVLANREPVSHARDTNGRITPQRSTSGLVTALEPLVRATSGVWVAHASGAADRLTVDAQDGFEVQADDSSYRLRRVWLDEHDVTGYYDGFANEALWPLCHRAHVRPVFRCDDFNSAWRVTSRFVDAVCAESRNESPIVLVHDYHMTLAPQLIRQRLPLSTISAFWHIPWPTWQTFEICPWGLYLVEGLLGANVIGFQTPRDCRNFIDTVEHSVEAHIDREHQAITHAGRRTLVRAYPCSIEWPDGHLPHLPDVEECREQVRRALGLKPDVRLGVGVARLDYTKGVEETFGAVERLCECYPEHRRAFTFVQIAEPSRTRVPAYRELRARVGNGVERLNLRFGTDSHVPALLLDAHHERQEVFRFLRAADFCYVGSLHDGMNLVSKEFVAARDDERGTLVLSRFAGAARELTDALIVNPYDLDETAHAFAEALAMSPDEQRHRMRAMRSIVAENNAYAWAAQVLADVSRPAPCRNLSVA